MANKKLPYLLGEIQRCANTAARFVSCCDWNQYNHLCTPSLTMNIDIITAHTYRTNIFKYIHLQNVAVFI